MRSAGKYTISCSEKTQSAKPSATVASAGGQQASAAKPETTKGLFTVTKQGEDYFFEIADSLLSREFLTTVRLTQAPANVGKFAGEQIKSANQSISRKHQAIDF